MAKQAAKATPTPFERYLGSVQPLEASRSGSEELALGLSTYYQAQNGGGGGTSDPMEVDPADPTIGAKAGTGAGVPYVPDPPNPSIGSKQGTIKYWTTKGVGKKYASDDPVPQPMTSPNDFGVKRTAKAGTVEAPIEANRDRSDELRSRMDNEANTDFDETDILPF